MLRINTFGTLRVERDGAPLAGATAQPRRQAILALAVRAAAQGVSRDKVMALLWPEVDDAQARRALNQAVYALRRDMRDEDAIVGTRDLRLDPTRVETDLWEFEAAYESRQYATAARLHEAPFLDGFHIGGSVEFERWLDAERNELRRKCAEAYRVLAAECEQRGAWREAVELWRRLAGLDPLDARVALSLMKALEASGDRTAALRHARLYEALAAQELDLPPDREVVAFARELRGRAAAEAAESKLSASPSPTAAGVPAAEAPAGTPPEIQRPLTPFPAIGRVPTPRSSRVGQLALLAAGITISVALGSWGIVRARADGPPLSGGVVAIGRVEERSGGQPGDAATIASLLATAFVRGGVQVVSPARIDELARTASADVDPSRDAARRAGAGYVIDATLVRTAEGLLRLDLRKVAVESGRIVRAQTSLGGDVLTVVDSAAAGMLRATR